jgi:hypothetical protein
MWRIAPDSIFVLRIVRIIGIITWAKIGAMRFITAISDRQFTEVRRCAF